MQNGPKTINDLKLINAGKILENSKTLADSRVILGEIPGCVITMHVVLRPPTNDKASGTTTPSTSCCKDCACDFDIVLNFKHCTRAGLIFLVVFTFFKLVQCNPEKFVEVLYLECC